MAGRSGTPGSLEVTPTWIFALVCGVFILVSLIFERIIHYIGKWLNKRPEKSLNNALDKIKEELMLLGFVSLLLSLVQPYIEGICVPHSFEEHMLPCEHNSTSSVHHGRLMFAESHTRRILAGGETSSSKCYDEGKVPFITVQGVHQLHIFIFVLAIGHVIYTCFTLLSARIKVHAWRSWEKKTQTNSSVLRKESTFVRKHASSKWKSSKFLRCIRSFFIQFGGGVTCTEYKSLRQGFIDNHKLANTFDFHKHIIRALERDFKTVAGISPGLWLFVVIFLILNVHGLYTYFWIGFIPLVLLFLIGAKLHYIVLTLANEIAEKSGEGAIVLNLSNHLFWFKRPKLILQFLHFVLFQNAFELAFFCWVWTTFGFGTCFRDKFAFVVGRLLLSVFMLVMSSYRTLPLYALVRQMGTIDESDIASQEHP